MCRVSSADSLFSRESASLILSEYLKSIGGRDALFKQTELALKTKKRGRPSQGTPSASGKKSRRNGDHATDSDTPVSAKNVEWKPPAGSWEDHIAHIDACEDEITNKLMVYLTWKNGQKTVHETKVVYQRCPQKVWFSFLFLLFGCLGDLEAYQCSDATILRATRADHQSPGGLSRNS